MLRLSFFNLSAVCRCGCAFCFIINPLVCCCCRCLLAAALFTPSTVLPAFDVIIHRRFSFFVSCTTVEDIDRLIRLQGVPVGMKFSEKTEKCLHVKCNENTIPFSYESISSRVCFELFVLVLIKPKSIHIIKITIRRRDTGNSSSSNNSNNPQEKQYTTMPQVVAATLALSRPLSSSSIRKALPFLPFLAFQLIFLFASQDTRWDTKQSKMIWPSFLYYNRNKYPTRTTTRERTWNIHLLEHQQRQQQQQQRRRYHQSNDRHHQ